MSKFEPCEVGKPRVCCVLSESWGRCVGLVASALDFQSGGWWFEPSLCRRVVSLDKKLYSTLSLFTQVYKWVPAIIRLGGNPHNGLASHPGGNSNIPSRIMLQRPELSAGLMGLLAYYADFSFTFYSGSFTSPNCRWDHLCRHLSHMNL